MAVSPLLQMTALAIIGVDAYCRGNMYVSNGNALSVQWSLRRNSVVQYIIEEGVIPQPKRVQSWYSPDTQCTFRQEIKHEKHHTQRYHRNMDQDSSYFRGRSLCIVGFTDSGRKHSDPYCGAAAQISAQEELFAHSESGRS